MPAAIDLISEIFRDEINHHIWMIENEFRVGHHQITHEE